MAIGKFKITPTSYVVFFLAIGGRGDLCTQQRLQAGLHGIYPYHFPILQRLKLNMNFPQIPCSYCFGDGYVSLIRHTSRRLELGTQKKRTIVLLVQIVEVAGLRNNSCGSTFPSPWEAFLIVAE